MPILPRRPLNRRQRTGWRDYQADLQSRKGLGCCRRSGIRRTFAVVLLTLVAVAGVFGFFRSEGGPPLAAVHGAASAPSTELVSKEDVRRLLDTEAFVNLTEENLDLQVDGRLLQAETTLDVELQKYLLEKIDREHSRYVGIVVMEGATGKILAMASFDKTDPSANPCLGSRFPAASVFKIVSAAAAVDQCGYSADSPVHFSGPKHTLYKRQLTDAVDRWTTTISFREAFAESVNPVFGKIGRLRLGKQMLEKAAEGFGFNEPLDFELPLPPSRFQVGDEPYNWAEAASGFNLDTTISPLHGAVMASAVLNAGRMVMPSIVERIVDESGEVLYRRQAAPEEHRAMSARAAAAMSQLMETTITSGTARKAFRHFRQDKVLSRLQIGGKTGSIDNKAHDVRYDWFVGFAKERQGLGQVVVAALVGHEKYIGIRASEYARMAITSYFGNRAGKASPPSGTGSGEAARRILHVPSRPT